MRPDRNPPSAYLALFGVLLLQLICCHYLNRHNGSPCSRCGLTQPR